jgi:hypothetical protein
LETGERGVTSEPPPRGIFIITHRATQLIHK